VDNFLHLVLECLGERIQSSDLEDLMLVEFHFHCDGGHRDRGFAMPRTGGLVDS